MDQTEEPTTETQAAQSVVKTAKAKSSYLHFCESRRESLKKEKPSLSPKEVMRELGSLWRVVKEDPEQFEKFEEWEQTVDVKPEVIS